MPARRCSTCSVNWPNMLPDFRECPTCDAVTWYSQNADALSKDEALKIKAEAAKSTSAAGFIRAAEPSPAHAHRVERYTSLGFTEVDAQVLACARWRTLDTKARVWELPLDWQMVDRSLKAGATHAEAVAIYA